LDFFEFELELFDEFELELFDEFELELFDEFDDEFELEFDDEFELELLDEFELELAADAGDVPIADSTARIARSVGTVGSAESIAADDTTSPAAPSPA
jgi:hypothetical protein